MKGAKQVANRLLRSVGTFQGSPRILNVDTGTYTMGYTEVNVQATTAFSRTKMHKAWLSGDTDIIDGTRIVDRVDGHKYIVMSLKTEYTDGENAFIDGTLMYVPTTCTISRVGTNVDAFGRASDAAFTPVADEVWLMTNPIATVPIEFTEGYSQKDKIKVAVQSSVDVRINDRLTTTGGDVLKVEAVNTLELTNIKMLHVSLDDR